MARTLLYVDPDAATRRLVRKSLEPAGYLVLEAESPAEGRESAARARPDIILVDVDQLDGGEALAPLRQWQRLEHVPMLASTARVSSSDPERSTGDFDGVLLKPLDIDALPDQLASSLPPLPESVKEDTWAPDEGWEEGAALVSPAVDLEPVEEPPRGVLLEGVVGSSSAHPVVALEPVTESQRWLPLEGVEESSGPVPDVDSIEQAGDEAPSDGPASMAAPRLDEGPTDEAPSAAAIEVTEMPALWRLNLGPVTESFVRSIPTTHGLLALLDAAGDALTVVAAASLRPTREATVLGARILLTAAPWLRPTLDARQPIVLATEAIGSSPLIPGESNAILVVPVATSDRLYGLVILGEQRHAKVTPFTPATIARSVAEVRQIATVVEAVMMLDASIRQKREELDVARRGVVRGLLPHVKERLKGRRVRKAETSRGRRPQTADDGDGQDGLTWLALYVAGRVGLPASERETLCQALEVLEIGRTWLEELLFPRTTMSDSDRAALLLTTGDHSAEIARALDWPAPALELVRTHQAWWNGKGHPAGLGGAAIPLGARIIAVLSAYRRLVAAGTQDDAELTRRAIAALQSESATRFDPDVISALTERLGG